MTKTLTEQWQEGKLKEGYYYTLLDTDSKMIEINYCWDDGCFQDYCDNMIDEVLATVPNYDKYKEFINKNKQIKRLKKQLQEANNCIVKTEGFLENVHGEISECLTDYLKKWGVK